MQGTNTGACMPRSAISVRVKAVVVCHGEVGRGVCSGAPPQPSCAAPNPKRSTEATAYRQCRAVCRCLSVLRRNQGALLLQLWVGLLLTRAAGTPVQRTAALLKLLLVLLLRSQSLPAFVFFHDSDPAAHHILLFHCNPATHYTLILFHHRQPATHRVLRALLAPDHPRRLGVLAVYCRHGLCQLCSCLAVHPLLPRSLPSFVALTITIGVTKRFLTGVRARRHVRQRIVGHEHVPVLVPHGHFPPSTIPHTRLFGTPVTMPAPCCCCG
mmetsp:Transcript_11577/g.30268  ORF Transcript_11577/g.30268 Transcript_11577/m.30268 type:complete len:269 (+) Transcript_11577:2164-2970(+)